MPTRRRRTGPLLRQKRQRLQPRNLERLAAADVGAGQFVVAAHHIGLRLGEAGSVALVGVARQLRPFAANYPGNFVFPRLAALGAGQSVAALLRRLVEKFPLFHGSGSSPEDSIYSILDLTTTERKTIAERATIPGIEAQEMTKRKLEKFSVTKAVKANARERVGQPKPARVLDTEPRTGREAKHKPKLEQLIQRED